MKESIYVNNTNNNENENFIFYVDEKKKNSQGYIKFDVSDFPDLKTKHYGVFSLKNKKDDGFKSWDDFDIFCEGQLQAVPLTQMSYDENNNSNQVKGSNKYVYGARFCFSDQEIKAENANNLFLDDKNLIWLEIKVEENGDNRLYKYDTRNKEWIKTNFRFSTLDLYDNGNTDAKNADWKTWPRNDKVLMRFNCMDCISLKKNEDNSLLSKQYSIDGVLEKNDITHNSPNLKVYACIQFEDGGYFYLNNCDYATSYNFLDNLTVYNYINGENKDVCAVRFYVTEKNLNVKHGEKFDEYLLKARKMSVFEIKKDDNNNMVPYFYDFDEKKWLPVHAKVECKIDFNETDVNAGRDFQEIHQYVCSVTDGLEKSNNVQSLSYSIEHNYMGKCEADYRRLDDICDVKPNLEEIEFFKPMNIFAIAIWFVRKNFSKTIFCALGAAVSVLLWSWIPAVCFIVLFAVLLFFDKHTDVPGIGEFSFEKQSGKPPVPQERDELINIVDNGQPEQNFNMDINNYQQNDIQDNVNLNNFMLQMIIQASLNEQRNQNHILSQYGNNQEENPAFQAAILESLRGVG